MILEKWNPCVTGPRPVHGVMRRKEITQEQIKDEVDKSVYMDPAQSVEERVSALLSQMTLGEKVGNAFSDGKKLK